MSQAAAAPFVTGQTLAVAGRLVGMDIDQTGQMVDVSRLETVQSPAQTHWSGKMLRQKHAVCESQSFTV